MRFCFSRLALTAGVLASSVGAILPQEIPGDLPVSSLLTSAQTHLARGETRDALTYYDAAIARDPTNYLSFFKRATTYLSLGRTKQATEDFHRVLLLKPGFHGAHLQLAKLRSKVGDWDAAREQYTASGMTPDSPEIEELSTAQHAASLAQVAEQNEQWEDCIYHSGVAILVASRAPRLRELRSHCRFERGQAEEGINDLQHVLQLRLGDIAPHVVISATTYYGLGDIEGGLSQVRKCLHSDPDSKVCKALHKQQKTVHKLYTKAVGQLNRGQSTTAGRTLVGSIDDPGLLPTVQKQIEDLKKTGNIPAKAKSKLYERILDFTCQAYSESNNKDASKYCDETLLLNPDSFWGLVHQGKTLLKKEEFELSIQALEKAAEAYPEKRDKVNPILNKAHVALKRSKSKDYYKILGVANDVDEKQIKSAYRKASKRFHPDKAAKQGITKEDAEKKMAAINEAYEILGNPELRARFDRGDDPNSQEGGNPFEGSPFGGGHPFMYQQGPNRGQQFKFDFGGGGGPFGF